MGGHHIADCLRGTLLTLLVLLARVPAVSGLTADRAAQLGGFVEARMALDRIPGLTLGYYRGDRLWVRAYGVADLETGSPTTPRSVYRLASVTKPLTATAVMMLRERGRLDLDDEIHTHVPEFRRYAQPITIRQLLAHTAGVRHNTPAESNNRRPFTTRETVLQYNDSALLAVPGQAFNYSTPGYNLLGAAIESASGMPYDRFLRRAIWQPLGLTTMDLDRPASTTPAKVRGYNFVAGEVRPTERVDVSNKFAAGGLQSSVGDLLGFARGLNRGRLLSEASRRTMYARQVTADKRFAHFEVLDRDYALGWFARPVNGVPMRYHDGGQPETTAVLVNFPTRDMAIALACNREWADLWPYVAKLYTTLTGRDWEIEFYTPRPDQRVIQGAMQTIFSQGVSAYEQGRYSMAALTDARRVARAVDFFNSVLSPPALGRDPQRVASLLETGRQPIGGRMLDFLGAHMMHTLVQAQGPGQVDVYQQKGAFDFFAAYIRQGRKQGTRGGPAFSPWFQELSLAWQRAWQDTWTPALRDLYFAAPNQAAPRTVLRLAQQLRGKPLYPDFSDRLLETCRLASAGRDWQTYFEAASLAADLYPTHDTALGYRAIALLIFNHAEEARTVLRQAANLRPDGFASPRNLESNARALASVDLAGPSRALLDLARSLRQ